MFATACGADGGSEEEAGAAAQEPRTERMTFTSGLACVPQVDAQGSEISYTNCETEFAAVIAPYYRDGSSFHVGPCKTAAVVGDPENPTTAHWTYLPGVGEDFTWGFVDCNYWWDGSSSLQEGNPEMCDAGIWTSFDPESPGPGAWFSQTYRNCEHGASERVAQATVDGSGSLNGFMGDSCISLDSRDEDSLSAVVWSSTSVHYPANYTTVFCVDWDFS